MSEWELVYSKTYPDAYTYNGKATLEEAVFLVDPLKILFGNWYDYFKYEFHKEIEKRWEEEGVKGLKLEIYVGKEKYLWGLIEYPKVRVVSIHTSKSIVLVLILLTALAFIVYLIFHDVKEIDWKAIGMGLGLPIIILAIIFLLMGRRGRD